MAGAPRTGHGGAVRRLSPPTLALLALACACAPQDPADLPYRSGTIERFADGSVRKGELVEPTPIGGFPAMAHGIGDQGQVRDVPTRPDLVLGGAVVRVHFDPISTGNFD